MARKNNTEELIHCNVCGEDYSATYRRCPFCGERMDARSASEDEDYDDGYVFDGQDLFDDPEPDQSAPSKGGKRLAAASGSAPKSSGKKSQSSGRYDPTGPVNWTRLITYGISLIIIIAALIIVFTVIYPMVHTPDDPVDPTPPTTSTEPSDPVTESPEPSTDPGTESPDPSTDPGTEPSTAPGELGPGVKGYITGAASGLRVRSGPGTTYEILASLVNGNEVTIVEDAGNGWYKITYSGANGQDYTGYIMGDYIAISGNAASQPSPSPSGGLTPGATGKITGAPSGLNVRSGPGTSYDILAGLVNGSEVTILEDAGNGWYKISYYGNGGVATTGYIMGTYIAVD